MELEYIKGYRACLSDLEDKLNTSIRNNNGATTPMSIVNVFNDMVHYIHTERSNLRHYLDTRSDSHQETTLTLIINN